MIAMRFALDTRAKRLAALAGLIGMMAVGSAGVVLFASVNGQPRQIFALQAPPPPDLPAGEDVWGWASLDRDSIHVGQIAALTVRIVYRDDAVQPDLDTLRRSVSPGRFSRVDFSESRRSIAPGISEFTLIHQLQGVSVLPHRTYQIDPVVLFYRSSRSNAGELQKLRIATPDLFISGYYPEDVTGLAPRPLRGNIRDPILLRQATVVGCALVLALIAGALVWWFGRRRTERELSDAERLWLEFDAAALPPRTPHDDLLMCESVFARLRQACAKEATEAFWTGDEPDDFFWRERSDRARTILRMNYGPAGASAGDAERMRALVRETFAAAVGEARLRREQETSLWRRMAGQPLPLLASGFCAVSALALFVLGALPAIWLAPSVARYNAALEAARSEPVRMQAANDLFALGQQAVPADLKAAAFYNAGTLLALVEPLNDQLTVEPMGIIDRFKDAASLETVVKSQATLAMAVERLRDAAAAAHGDEDIGRNLELVGKRHRIVVAALVELIKMQEERVAEMQDLRTLLDALNMVLHEDARENEQAQKPDYYIGEKF